MLFELDKSNHPHNVYRRIWDSFTLNKGAVLIQRNQPRKFLNKIKLLYLFTIFIGDLFTFFQAKQVASRGHTAFISEFSNLSWFIFSFTVKRTPIVAPA